MKKPATPERPWSKKARTARRAAERDESEHPEMTRLRNDMNQVSEVLRLLRQLQNLPLLTLLFSVAAHAGTTLSPGDEFPSCDAFNHGKVITITDPVDADDCTVGTGSGPNGDAHLCVCQWDGATGAWTATADNLGDHTATQDLDMAGFDIDDAGTVGIGTSAVALIELKMEVNGPVNLEMKNTSASGKDWFLNSENSGIFGISAAGTGGTELVLTAGGDVGLGAASPSRRLHLADSPPAVRFENLTGAHSWEVQVDSSDNFIISDVTTGSDAIFIENQDAALERIRIDGAGRFSIGDSSPVGLLHVTLGSGEAVCIETASGTGCDFGLLATAPATCTAPGDSYTDTSGAKCQCWTTDTWSVAYDDGAASCA